jgi:hypothetical protein
MKTILLTSLFVLFGLALFAQNVNYYVAIENDYTGTSHNLSGRMNIYHYGDNHDLAHLYATDTFHFWNVNQYGQNVYYCSLPVPNPNQEILSVDAFSSDPNSMKSSHWHGSCSANFDNGDPKNLPPMHLTYDQGIPNPK